MAREQMLLDRLAGLALADASQEPQTTEENLGSLAESVRRNLRRLLNARHGMSEAQEDYGLPALADVIVGSGDHVRLVVEAIRTAIEKYEPRLRNVRVTPQLEEARPDALVFRVDATLAGRLHEARVWYQASLRPEGQFDVAG
jgi:type VI secretion system protein